MKYILTILLLWAVPASAASVIRDAEIEDYLHEIARPILKEAEIEGDVNITILKNNSLNAFVTAGNNMFIHTGLISFSDTPELLIGVMAHEVGHLAAGHITANSGKRKDSALLSLLGFVVGTGIMADAQSQDADVGIAIATATQQFARRDYLKFSRQNESIADQLAIKYMRKMQVSPVGLLTLLKKLNSQNSFLLKEMGVDKYELTHPVTSSRIEYVKSNLKGVWQSKRNTKLKHQMVKAKLDAYIAGKVSNLSPQAKKYSQAIILHRAGKKSQSLAKIDSLIAGDSENPYFYDTKGQILYENGDYLAAAKNYRKAYKLHDNILMRLGYAKSLLKSGSYVKAIAQLEVILNEEPKNLEAWKNLSLAYGKKGKLGASYYALAERSYLLKNTKRAEEYITLARKYLQPSDSYSTKLDDLEYFIEND